MSERSISASLTNLRRLKYIEYKGKNYSRKIYVIKNVFDNDSASDIEEYNTSHLADSSVYNIKNKYKNDNKEISSNYISDEEMNEELNEINDWLSNFK